MGGEEVTRIYTCNLALRDIEASYRSKTLIVHALDTATGYTEIQILDFSGDVQKTIANGVSATLLSPAGDRIAYTKGQLDEDRKTVSQGTWILDRRTGEEILIVEGGLYLERADFNNSLYIRTSGDHESDYRYDIETGELEKVALEFGGFSPDGEYRWRYKATGGVEIVRRETGEEISKDFQLLKSRRHGTPLYWMAESIVMLPHYREELEDYLLFVENGKTLKVPGRAMSLSTDEEHIYVCKPGLIVEKLPLSDLEVLFGDGKEKSGDF